MSGRQAITGCSVREKEGLAWGAGGRALLPVCSLKAGVGIYCIETRKILEVLGSWNLQRIPLAPAYIAGVIANRGAVLTTVSLRALLGLEECREPRAVLVLE